MIFGEALGRSFDLDTIHDVVVQHLHRLAGSDDAWAMMHIDGHWKVLVVAARENKRELESFQEQIADRAVSIYSSGSAASSMSILGHLCVPMVAGGRAIGVWAFRTRLVRLPRGAAACWRQPPPCSASRSETRSCSAKLRETQRARRVSPAASITRTRSRWWTPNFAAPGDRSVRCR